MQALLRVQEPAPTFSSETRQVKPASKCKHGSKTRAVAHQLSQGAVDQAEVAEIRQAQLGQHQRKQWLGDLIQGTRRDHCGKMRLRLTGWPTGLRAGAGQDVRSWMFRLWLALARDALPHDLTLRSAGLVTADMFSLLRFGDVTHVQRQHSMLHA